MSEIIERSMAFVLGGLVGYAYFGGLWMTLKYLSKTQRQVSLAIGSYFIRLLVCAVCFYWVAIRSDWVGVLICLAGVLLVRNLFVHHIRREINS